jgi:hypothetical protein
VPSHFDPSLSISVVAPVGWERERTEEFPLFLLAPREGDYRSNLGFSRAAAAEATPALMAAAIAGARAQQKAEYARFEELAASDFELDGAPAFLQHYRWQPDGAAQPFMQLFGLVQTDAHGLIEINASTLQSLAEHVLPVIGSIIESVRFIPFPPPPLRS